MATFGVVMTSRIPAIMAAAQAQAALIVAKAALDVEGKAKMGAPVDTGHLKGSVQAKDISQLEWEVRVGADYGIYVEFGTSRMAAHPYLVPAAELVRPSFVAAMATLAK